MLLLVAESELAAWPTFSHLPVGAGRSRSETFQLKIERQTHCDVEGESHPHRQRQVEKQKDLSERKAGWDVPLQIDLAEERGRSLLPTHHLESLPIPSGLSGSMDLPRSNAEFSNRISRIWNLAASP
ncbi:hypothetical protein [Limimaricola soesokkakensis]|uniref:hypothetical protein n=1 Tax=Limimaricola soesokkakensis TaxID=1343159 RepID=UPI0035165A32